MSAITTEDHQHHQKNQAHQASQKNQKNPANVEGVINQINTQTRVANISRSSIEKGGADPVTRDYVFSNSVSLNELQQGDKIRFTFEIQNDALLITDYALLTHEPMPMPMQEHNHD
jgi:Cu(I)/Ag(I) efflux system membrane fusion protein